MPQLTFPAYTIGAAAFWGQFLLVFFIGTGFISIPFSYIVSWIERPIPMNEHQFKTDKDTLAKQIDLLLKKGKSIYEEKLKLDSSW